MLTAFLCPRSGQQQACVGIMASPNRVVHFRVPAPGLPVVVPHMDFGNMLYDPLQRRRKMRGRLEQGLGLVWSTYGGFYLPAALTWTLDRQGHLHMPNWVWPTKSSVGSFNAIPRAARNRWKNQSRNKVC